MAQVKLSLAGGHTQVLQDVDDNFSLEANLQTVDGPTDWVVIPHGKEQEFAVKAGDILSIAKGPDGATA